MKLTDNTVFITGGGSGIGRGLAEALHRLGNQVIIGGRRLPALQSVVSANPGMHALEVNVAEPASVRRAAKRLIADYPSLNVLINNAGIMLFDEAAGALNEKTLDAELQTNLAGPIRLTAALIEHLKNQKRATIIYNSSTLAFTPLAAFALYSATKAAVHSYAMSQRFALRDTSVSVQELVPPWVGTGLVGSADDPRAMPLGAFVEETIDALASEAEEIVVQKARINRDNAGPNEHKFVQELNTYMASALAGS